MGASDKVLNVLPGKLVAIKNNDIIRGGLSRELGLKIAPGHGYDPGIIF